MNYEELTIGQAKEIAAMFGPSASAPKTHSFKTGVAYIIRTVTMIYTGRLERITDTDLMLMNAAWIADTGRWANALATGELSEVEPYPGGVIINREAIVDASVWGHELPREVK